MKDEIKEISKIDKQLLDKIEHILGSELSSEEYDKFYNYFNEIRKPNILIDIKDVEIIKDYITNLQDRIKELDKYKNIVDELEKYLEWSIGQDMYRLDFKIILDKLQELKGSDN